MPREPEAVGYQETRRILIERAVAKLQGQHVSPIEIRQVAAGVEVALDAAARWGWIEAVVGDLKRGKDA